jgi:glycerophosphoryl diester phosphodiesterase
LFLRVGHRGARAYEVENTIESFRKAIELGANAIEFDLQQTADKKLVISHDDNLKRVFGQDVPINDSLLKDLKALTVDKMPAFQEALEFIDDKVDKIIIELKKEGYEKEVLRQIRKSGTRGRIIVVSFHESCLSEIRRSDKDIETGLIYARYKDPVASANKLKAQYLLPLYRFTHSKNIEEAHRNNLKVVVWTINSKEEAEKYRAKGVDGIASDKPDILGP